MKRMVIVVFLVIISVGFDCIAQCTIFTLCKDSVTVYGQNLDWKTPVPGFVIINKRGERKSILHWKGNWPAKMSDSIIPVTWRAKYGSVTFTYLGKDFIEGGMNEAGLMIDEASYIAQYPPPDYRPGVSCGQWMQYQLDNYKTVDQLIVYDYYTIRDCLYRKFENTSDATIKLLKERGLTLDQALEDILRQIVPKQ